MRVLFVVALVLTAFGCDVCAVDPLVGYCVPDVACAEVEGEVVFDVPSRVCFPGRTVCAADETVTCVGQVACSPEVCDGIDNDGDNAIDEYTRKPYNTADFNGFCDNLIGSGCGGTLWVECSDGQPFCVVDSRCTDEICDGIDNDGDGVVDNGLEPVFFYPEDQYPGTVGIGECRPGVKACYGGHEEFVAARTPRVEEDNCGNGLDDDCDGVIDDSDGDGRGVAVSFVVDVSGSNSGAFPSIKTGLCSYAQIEAARHPESRFALTIFGNDTVAYATIVQDMTDSATFCAALDTYLVTDNSAEEMQIEALLVASTVTWPPALQRHVVMVSDETIHTVNETTSDGLDRAANNCLDVGYEFHSYGFASTDFEWGYLADLCANAGNEQHNLGGIADTQQLIDETVASCN